MQKEHLKSHLPDMQSYKMNVRTYQKCTRVVTQKKRNTINLHSKISEINFHQNRKRKRKITYMKAGLESNYTRSRGQSKSLTLIIDHSKFRAVRRLYRQLRFCIATHKYTRRHLAHITRNSPVLKIDFEIRVIKTTKNIDLNVETDNVVTFLFYCGTFTIKCRYNT